jgi:hypothetical protein
MPNNAHADPDLRHLLRLLAMLPSLDSRESGSFWTDYRRAHPDAHPEDDYMIKKLSTYVPLARGRDVSWENARHIAEYSLMFFDVGQVPECLVLLDRVMPRIPPVHDGAIGRRWIDSVCNSAWQLCVTAEEALR